MIDEALATLRALADDDKAAEMAAYHKAPRVYLGVTVPQITELANGWREQLTSTKHGLPPPNSSPRPACAPMTAPGR